MKLTNQDLAQQFLEMSEIINNNLESPNDKFRSGSYAKTAEKLQIMKENLSKKDVKELMKLDGIGKSTAEKIVQAFKSKDKTIPKLKELRKKYCNSGFSKEIKEKIKPVLAVLGLNDAKNLKLSTKNNSAYIQAKISSKKMTRLFNMLDGISFAQKSKTERKCAGVPVFLTIQ